MANNTGLTGNKTIKNKKRVGGRGTHYRANQSGMGTLTFENCTLNGYSFKGRAREIILRECVIRKGALVFVDADYIAMESCSVDEGAILNSSIKTLALMGTTLRHEEGSLDGVVINQMEITDTNKNKLYTNSTIDRIIIEDMDTDALLGWWFSDNSDNCVPRLRL